MDTMKLHYVNVIKGVFVIEVLVFSMKRGALFSKSINASLKLKKIKAIIVYSSPNSILIKSKCLQLLLQIKHGLKL